MQLTKVPSIELVNEIYQQIANATREEYEVWRSNVSDVFVHSHAREGIPTRVHEWAKEQLAIGERTVEQISSGAIGGAMLSAFQLGLLVGKKLQEKVN